MTVTHDVGFLAQHLVKRVSGNVNTATASKWKDITTTRCGQSPMDSLNQGWLWSVMACWSGSLVARQSSNNHSLQRPWYLVNAEPKETAANESWKTWLVGKNGGLISYLCRICLRDVGANKPTMVPSWRFGGGLGFVSSNRTLRIGQIPRHDGIPTPCTPAWGTVVITEHGWNIHHFCWKTMVNHLFGMFLCHVGFPECDCGRFHLRQHQGYSWGFTPETGNQTSHSELPGIDQHTSLRYKLVL